MLNQGLIIPNSKYIHVLYIHSLKIFIDDADDADDVDDDDDDDGGGDGDDVERTRTGPYAAHYDVEHEVGHTWPQC